jgi:dipeptide/tripeptide permease
MSKRNSDWYIPPDWHWYLGAFIVLPCIMVLASILLPVVARLKTADMRALYGFGLGTGAIGAVLLFAARLPLYKQRRFWTIGPMQLDRKHRRIYWLAYAFVVASLLLLGVVWLRIHEN